ncbi:MAG TPA: hypothetical protein VJP86_13565 [Vicinamibacterales bacterium]|jgi:hypothetical protein|nr:hypothetical protein [Vicinamibacterales bacterium]
MPTRKPILLFWLAVLIGAAALIPIVAATLMIASVIWIPLVVLVVAGAITAFLVGSRREAAGHR